MHDNISYMYYKIHTHDMYIVLFKYNNTKYIQI